MPVDPQLPPVFTRSMALAAGMSRHQVSHRSRAGRWVTLGRGVYARSDLYDGLSDRDQHRLALVGTLLARRGDEVASHLSAAVVYDLPLPLTGAGRVTLTSPDLDDCTRASERFVRQVASLPERDRTHRTVSCCGTTWGVPVTSPARTVADNLRHLGLPDAVALGDGALRRGITTHDAVAEVLTRQERWPYADRGKLALPLLDPRRETWLESYSFARLHQLGIPMPEPQVTIRDGHGRFVARVDGWLHDWGVVLECDGREKYFMADLDTPVVRTYPAAVQDAQRLLARRMESEKRREEWLRDLGPEVVRWGTSEVHRSPETIADRIKRAAERASRRPFVGHAEYLPAPPWLMPAVGRAG
ncbi:type IV toxin-antitoxin system AbiEi family antitoxin domain-containing protein [Segeticoccus rhizosphaerae]|uniref:type IV toxin-antitoxin system AbiEi family antitoxin domain-containing protein n=1 Tax=Segeticoccus rhizosphaerae TaxID=1104777 RepID=UPI0010C00B90|nr:MULTISPECIES: type IV toxin-antitoxin system AbiEi family antitoxin domain-containing protein [Intrasporangiaceae]